MNINEKYYGESKFVSNECLSSTKDYWIHDAAANKIQNTLCIKEYLDSFLKENRNTILFTKYYKHNSKKLAIGQDT